MATTVTVSKFRENLSKYIDLVNEKGKRVDIVDGRKGKVMATLTRKKKKEFDWDAYMKFLKNFKPFWTKADDRKIMELRRRSRERLKRLNW